MLNGKVFTATADEVHLKGKINKVVFNYELRNLVPINKEAVMPF
jgi:hypothetical protein